MTDGPTDGWTDRWTDGRTDPLIEMRKPHLMSELVRILKNSILDRRSRRCKGNTYHAGKVINC